jgi:hypothetical protein
VTHIAASSRCKSKVQYLEASTCFSPSNKTLTLSKHASFVCIFQTLESHPPSDSCPHCVHCPALHENTFPVLQPRAMNARPFSLSLRWGESLYGSEMVLKTCSCWWPLHDWPCNVHCLRQNRWPHRRKKIPILRCHLYCWDLLGCVNKNVRQGASVCRTRPQTISKPGTPAARGAGQAFLATVAQCYIETYLVCEIAARETVATTAALCRRSMQ